nr:ank repeat containing [Hymenolepis microstoma]
MFDFVKRQIKVYLNNATLRDTKGVNWRPFESLYRFLCQSKISTMEVPQSPTMRKQNLYQKNNWLDVQSAHLNDVFYGITDIERKWRTAILKSDVSEMSRLLSENPELVNWQDYITGSALHFAAKANDVILVKLLAGTNKANVELRNHGVRGFGLVPLHMAAIGASEEVAFELMSRYGAKATRRDYSGRLPVSYLPDTEAGRRLKSTFRSQYAKMLEELPLLSKLVSESQPVPSTRSAHPTSSIISPLPPVAPLNFSPPPTSKSVDSKASFRSMKSSAVKHGTMFACASFRRKPSIRKEPHTLTGGRSELSGEQIISRDDLPPMTPTRITDFPNLSRRTSILRPGVGASEYCTMVRSTIRRRKDERGKNYNPTDPENQQTSFRRLSTLRSSQFIDRKDVSQPIPEPIKIPSAPIAPRLPRSKNRANLVCQPLPSSSTN